MAARFQSNGRGYITCDTNLLKIALILWHNAFKEKNTQTLLLSVDIKDPNIFIAKNSIQVLSNSVCWSDPSNEVTLSIADLEPKITLQYNKEENRFF